MSRRKKKVEETLEVNAEKGEKSPTLVPGQVIAGITIVDPVAETKDFVETTIDNTEKQPIHKIKAGKSETVFSILKKELEDAGYQVSEEDGVLGGREIIIKKSPDYRRRCVIRLASPDKTKIKEIGVTNFMNKDEFEFLTGLISGKTGFPKHKISLFLSRF